jgi:hypothetical protein
VQWIQIISISPADTHFLHATWYWRRASVYHYHG